MRDYYQHARNIYNITELLSERLCVAPSQPEKAPRLLGFLRRSKGPQKEHFDGFYSRDGRIYAESSNVFNQEPARMMRLFQHMQKRQLKLSPELRQMLRRRIHLVDRTFQYAKNQRETFTAILSRKGEVGAVHGAPVHVGNPGELGITDLSKPDFGDPVQIPEGHIPVFWACGVTPQAAVMESRPALAIGHAPGYMLITDAKDSDYLVP